MNERHAILIDRLKSNVDYKDYLTYLEDNLCPNIRSFAPGVSNDTWIYDSGLRAGYLLALSHLGADVNE